MSLLKLHELGYKTWVTDIWNLLREFKLVDLWHDQELYIDIKAHIYMIYQTNWVATLLNHDLYPIMRTYRLIKTDFILEPYMRIKDYQARKAITKLRMSSHDLFIEKGRHTKPLKTPVEQRICRYCNRNEVEDEVHFLIRCDYYEGARNKLLRDIEAPTESGWTDVDLFLWLLNNRCPDILTKVGKFIWSGFKLRTNVV